MMARNVVVTEFRGWKENEWCQWQHPCVQSRDQVTWGGSIGLEFRTLWWICWLDYFIGGDACSQLIANCDLCYMKTAKGKWVGVLSTLISEPVIICPVLPLSGIHRKWGGRFLRPWEAEDVEAHPDSCKQGIPSDARQVQTARGVLPLQVVHVTWGSRGRVSNAIRLFDCLKCCLVLNWKKK